MKRWIFRLLALSAMGGMGWGTVTWAQREFGASGTPQPDFSKPPVNAEAAAAVAPATPVSRYADQRTAGNRYGDVLSTAPPAAASDGQAPVDPFQNPKSRVVKAAAPASSQDAAPPDEPQRFTPAEDAESLADRRRNELREGIPSARDAGLASGTSDIPPANESFADTQSETSSGAARQADEMYGPVDPLGLNQNNTAPGEPTPAAGQESASTALAGDRYGAVTDAGRYRDLPPAADSANQAEAPPKASSKRKSAKNAAGKASNKQRVEPAAATGLAAATGALEAVQNEGNAAAENAAPAAADRYSDAGQREPAEKIDNARVPTPEMEARLASAAQQGNAATARDAVFPPAGPAGLSDAPASALVPGTLQANPAAAVAEGSGRPGDKKLEGAQSPNVTIEKSAPPEIQVGKPAKFQILVRNTGVVTAENVEVIDAVPQGTKLLETTPKASVGPRGEVVWTIGNMQPGDETRLELDVMPVAEGEIGSVAVVQFRSAASARTVATKPELTMELTAPEKVLIGSDTAIKIRLSNRGTGAANHIVLQEKVPPGLQHAAGAELEFEVGDLASGETRELDLSLRAVQAGKFANTIVAEGDANLRVEQTATIEVTAPAIEVGLDGPGLRYLERQAKYNVSVKNPGTAPAHDVELVTQLPKGLKFIEASDSGYYDSGSHRVIWSLAELPAGEAGNVSLTTMAMETGEQRLRSECKAAGGLSDTIEQATVVEGVAAVLFTVVDVDDPVEVGGEATYEINVVNQGSKAASRVQLAALLPPELKPLKADGPSKHSIQGQQVIFEPLPRLAPKADVTYRVTGQGLAAGDLRIKAQLITDEMTQPVTKEESTRVYKDE